MQFKALTLALISVMLSPALSQGLVVVSGSSGISTDSSSTLNALSDSTTTLTLDQNTVTSSTSQINEARNLGSLVSKGQLKGKAKGLQRIPTKSQINQNQNEYAALLDKILQNQSREDDSSSSVSRSRKGNLRKLEQVSHDAIVINE